MSKSVESDGQVGNANISMIMNSYLKALCPLLLGLTLAHNHSFAQTDGAARMAVTINDYNGSGASHWTVAWVTTGSGTFIKSLRKQGPSITSTHWNSHCGTWWAAKSGSTALDGYSSATAQNYAGTNSPVVLIWNCRDAANNLVADGDYKFWVQYAEDNGQGPYTTSGLLWTKGPGGVTNNYANQGANFTGMQVAWRPSTPAAPVAPTITSATPPATGTVGVSYNFTVTATGTAPITFTAPGLPTGVAISGAGVISGTPTATGTFTGTITAANGTLPNATQNFSIVMSVVETDFTAVQLNGNNLVMSGNGPANGFYAVLVATSANALPAQWTAIATNAFDNAGKFSFTNAISPGVPQKFYRLRVP